MTTSLRILQDRANIAALEHADPELAKQLEQCRIGKRLDRASIHFCGLAWVGHSSGLAFLPRKSLVDDPNENLQTARLTMKTLARFGREMIDRVGVASGSEGETGLLALISELAQDFVKYGIYAERTRYSSRHSGKPHWARTITQEAAFLDANGSVVYPTICTTRSKDSHASLLARVQASVLLEIAEQHAWWLDGLFGREEELKQYQSPVLPRTLWATRLRLILPELYASRAIRLATTLIGYLENDRDKQSGEVYFGVEDFHVVWEHMLRQVLIGVEPTWNSKLPRPSYHKRHGGMDIQDRGLQTDIVLRESSSRLRIVDAKYYDAITLASTPGTPDVIKQFFYDIALTSVAKGDQVDGCFVFPALPNETGSYSHITMRHRDGSLAGEFPKIDCFYLDTRRVMEAFVKEKKISLFNIPRGLGESLDGSGEPF